MKIIIVIPIYHEGLSIIERISCNQLFKVLGSYPISIVMPEKMGPIYNNFGECSIETFSDEYFKSPQTYSKLLMSV